jgi:hypothetical protein
MPLYFQSAHLEARHPFAISTVIEGGTAKTINSWERDLETQAGAILRLRIPAENAGNRGGGEENLAQRLLFRQ